MKRKRMLLLVVLVAAGASMYASRMWEPLVYEAEFTYELRNTIKRKRQWLRWRKMSTGTSTEYYLSGFASFTTGHDPTVREFYSVFKDDGTVSYQFTPEYTPPPEIMNLGGIKYTKKFPRRPGYKDQPPWWGDVNDQVEPNPPAWFYREELFEETE